jgi:hypothetical protein
MGELVVVGEACCTSCFLACKRPMGLWQEASVVRVQRNKGRDQGGPVVDRVLWWFVPGPAGLGEKRYFASSLLITRVQQT